MNYPAQTILLSETLEKLIQNISEWNEPTDSTGIRAALEQSCLMFSKICIEFSRHCNIMCTDQTEFNKLFRALKSCSRAFHEIR